MSDADKTTVKMRAYPENAKKEAPQSNLTVEQNNALELVKKNVQLEEEKKRSLELFKTIEHLSVSLKQEQTKTAEMEKKIVEMVKKMAEMEKKMAEHHVKANETSALEAKVKELSEVLDKISGIAAGKAG
jgi:hypothetical protein